MNNHVANYWILIPILLSGITGIGLLLSSLCEHIKRSRQIVNGNAPENHVADEQTDKQRFVLHVLVGTVLVISVISALTVAWTGERSLTLFYLMDEIPIFFQIYAVGRLFLTVTSVIWVAVCFYAFVYMKHEGEEKRFFGFFLLLYSVLVSLDFAGNLITFYFFYELMTLTSMPLVLHNGSKEAIMAALKYLFYSMLGASCALFGIYFLYQNCDTLTFTAGGTLNLAMAAESGGILLVAVCVMLIGFGAKAGMFPLHAWLSTAHPVAPAPASAALSSIIVKSGVLAIIRSVFYIVGPDFIRGTWVQNLWIFLTLLTVFMGSMLAYREKIFKKRLAYSTVSQVSYILFGLSLLNETAMTGSLLHFFFHAVIKCSLFLTAGIFIFRTGKTKVDEYAGIGKQMNITLWCYTFASLALIGIPPTSGFISKWYLAQGALQSDTGIFRIAGPIVLLISALLTAGYLLPITMKGFLPGKECSVENWEVKREKIDKMVLTLLVLAILAVVFGILPNPLIQYAGDIAASVM